MDRSGTEHLAYLGNRRTRDRYVIDRCPGIDNEAYAKLRLLLVRGSMSEVFRNLATRRIR
jgi:hypothetical protein